MGINKKCVSLYPASMIIITEDMDVYEVYFEDQENIHVGVAKATSGIPPEDYKGNYFVRKLPMKADIDFEDYYGDDGKANWWHPYLPVVEGIDNVLHWDY